MCSLAVCSIILQAEGIRRLMAIIFGGDTVTEQINGKVMSLIAGMGVIINICLVFILGVENHVHMPGDDHCHDHSNCNHGYSPAHSDEFDTKKNITDVDGIEMGICGMGARAKDKVKLTGFLQSMTFACHGHEHSHSHVHSNIDAVECNDFIQSWASVGNHNHEHSHSNGDDVDEEEIDHPGMITTCESVSRGVSVPKQNINMHAAYLHVIGDLIQSIAVLIAGLVIMYKPELRAIDPILSIICCPLILYSTFGVIRTSMQILLEGSPPSVNVDELWSDITNIEGITNVTNLHVWSISHGTVAMTVHARAMYPQTALHKIHELCTRRYGIDHCTIQIEDYASEFIFTSPHTAHFYAPVQGSSMSIV